MQKLSHLPHVPLRRSHLDSGTYRTLVRILSLCIDDSLTHPPPPPPYSASASDQSEEQKPLAVREVPVSDGNPNQSLSNNSRREERDKAACGRLPKDVACQDPTEVEKNDLAPEDPQLPDCQHEAFSPVEELGHGEKNGGKSDESANNELSKYLVDEDSKDVNAPSDIFCLVEESGNGVQEDIHISCNPNADFSELSNLGREPVRFSVELINEREVEEGEISDDLGVLDDQSSDLESEHMVRQERELEEGALSYKEDTACMLGTSSSKVEDFDAHIMTGRIAIQEAGSILTVCGESETWSHSSEDDKVIKSLEKNKGGNAAKKYSETGAVPDNLRLTAVFPENISVANEGNQPSTKDVEFCEKKKRAPLTESRKEKKKLAKKRKRAEQNRKLGVKRLKLQPILKPKKVIYCNFYLKGRCQQGDLCKFSHDTTPLTKSQPCKYHASQSCLKGEDCPFDHELSNYPCHNYLSKGMCSRGDTCKFSHKMPIGEGSSEASKISKPDSPVPLEKSSLGKRLNMDSTSPVINNPSGLAQPFSGHTHTAKSLSEKTLKPPARVPKGIRFLSFGNESLNEIDKQQINASSKKGGVIKTDSQINEVVLDNRRNSNAILAGSSGLGLPSHQSIKSLMDVHKNESSLVSKPPLQATYKSNILASRVIQSPPLYTFANKESKTSTCSSGSATMPYSGNLPNGLSDATKILEEFLFSGDS